jgi:hypothetical protein
MAKLNGSRTSYCSPVVAAILNGTKGLARRSFPSVSIVDSAVICLDSHGRLVEKQLRDLDGVEGGAFEELVAGDEHAEGFSGGVGDVGADAAAEDVALAGGVFGHGHVVVGDVVDDFDAGGGGEDGADFVGGDGAFAFDGEGFGVGAQDGDADAGGGDADGGVVEDFFGLFDHFHFFFVVAVGGVDLGVVAEEVEGVGVGEDGVFVLAAFEVGAGALTQFFHGGSAGAGGGLVGSGDEAQDAVLFVDRPEGGDGDDGGAVGVGDDAFVLLDGFGVDFGDHQGHGGFHAEGGAVVDDDGAGLHGDGAELFGDGAAGGEEGDVDAFEAGVGEFFDGDFFSLERHCFTGGAGGGEELEFLHGELALLEAGEEFDTDSAGGADDRNDR